MTAMAEGKHWEMVPEPAVGQMQSVPNLKELEI